MASVVYLTKEQINATVGSGKNLGLSPVQCDSLNANFKNKISEYLKNLNTVSIVEPTNEADSGASFADALNSDVISPMSVNEDTVLNSPSLVVEAPVVDSPSVVDTSSLNDSLNSMNSDVIQPFAPDAPAMDSVLNMSVSDSLKGQDVSTINPVVSPSIEESNDVNLEASSVNSVQPEIVSAVQETDFDLMKKEIEAVTEDYKNKVIQIMEAYEKKINEMIRQANEYKAKAQEHLKNAQAAEQIAEIARQNSKKVQDLQNSVELEKVV